MNYFNNFFINNVFLLLIIYLPTIYLIPIINKPLMIIIIINCLLHILCWWTPNESIMKINTFLPKLFINPTKCFTCHKLCYPWDYSYDICSNKINENCILCNNKIEISKNTMNLIKNYDKL